MKITLGEFFLWQEELPVIVHSIDMVGYQASVVIDGQQHTLVNNHGKPLRKKSLMEMRESLMAMPVSSLVLTHQSAYDEMINQPLREATNELQLPLSREMYPFTRESPSIA